MCPRLQASLAWRAIKNAGSWSDVIAEKCPPFLGNRTLAKPAEGSRSVWTALCSELKYPGAIRTHPPGYLAGAALFDSTKHTEHVIAINLADGQSTDRREYIHLHAVQNVLSRVRLPRFKKCTVPFACHNLKGGPLHFSRKLRQHHARVQDRHRQRAACVSAHAFRVPARAASAGSRQS